MIYYTVYRTQNIVNGKYYFGVHKTKNPHDGYLGSGRILKRAVAKYGEASFLKNVCFIFDNPEEAFAKEFELIETYREDPLCYNLRQGGSGGFDWINREGLNAAGVSKGGKIRAILYHREPSLKKRIDSCLALGRQCEALKQHCRKMQQRASLAAAAKARKLNEKAKAIELFNSGILRSQIAKQLGVAKSSVSGWVKVSPSS